MNSTKSSLIILLLLFSVCSQTQDKNLTVDESISYTGQIVVDGTTLIMWLKVVVCHASSLVPPYIIQKHFRKIRTNT